MLGLGAFAVCQQGVGNIQQNLGRNAVVEGGQPCAVPNNTIAPALADGTYDVSVNATDGVGNLGSDASVDELVIDTAVGVITDIVGGCEDIDDLRMSDLSMMPEGYEKLPAEELTSLLDYLTAREKFLPLPLQKVATAVSTRGMFHTHASTTTGSQCQTISAKLP